jgi:DNA primase
MTIEKPDLSSVLDYYCIDYNPGKNSQKILCPVHEERVPSCSVDLSDNVYNCHACKSMGDSLTLIQEKERCDFATALSVAKEILANGGRSVSLADGPEDEGLFGRKRSVSRSGRRAPYRPRLYSDGRP